MFHPAGSGSTCHVSPRGLSVKGKFSDRQTFLIDAKVERCRLPLSNPI